MFQQNNWTNLHDEFSETILVLLKGVIDSKKGF